MDKKNISDIEKIVEKEGITSEELKAILKSSRRSMSKRIRVNINGKHIKYGYFSDAHIGHKMFKEDLWNVMCKYFKDEKVDFIIDVGDHLEGMSGRPGHIYELTHIGFDQQCKYAIELYSNLPEVTIYSIDGNHDQWYACKNNGGVVVGNELENKLKNFKFMGQDEGDIVVSDNCKIKLFHPNDGTAYADSYKLQKLIESFQGGEKPNIVHEGHYHKQLYMFKRNVHGFESGTLSSQSKFMRGKKISAAVGFGVVDVWIGKRGVERLDHKFIPNYD